MSVKVLGLDELRKEFEISLLFDEHIVKGPNWLVIDDNGKYRSPTIQAAWLGFQMYAGNAHAMLRRFDPDRCISNGMVSSYLKELSTLNATGDVKDVFKLVLRIAGNSPA